MGAKPSKQTSFGQEMEAIKFNDHDSSQGHAIFELLRLECFKGSKIKNKKKGRQLHPLEQSSEKATKLTLEDWLLSTPRLKADSFSEGELCVLKHISVKLRPSSTRETGLDVKASESFSLERLVLLDRARDLEEDCFRVSSLDMSSGNIKGQARKLQKRVRFKLPEEADIIIFRSPIPE